MIIGIGTQNKAKLKACDSAFKKLETQFPNIFSNTKQITALAVESTVPEMPLSLNDLLKGARNRAFFVFNHFKDQSQKIDISIGMEGGVFSTSTFNENDAQAILQNWVYVFDGKHGSFGCSAGLALPDKISRTLFDDQKELAEVIDYVSGKTDVRSNEGAFGILTEQLYTRSDAFESALINAMIPFLNEKYYKK